MGVGDREHYQDRWTLSEIRKLIFKKFQFSTTIVECSKAIKNTNLRILHNANYEPAHVNWKKSLSKKYLTWKESPEAKALLKTEKIIAQKIDIHTRPRHASGMSRYDEEALKETFRLLLPSNPWITNPKFWTRELLEIKNNKI